MPNVLPKGCVPVMSAPMILPWMAFPCAVLPATHTPAVPFPEIRLPGGVPGVAVRPPMTLLEVPLVFTPTFGLDRTTVPVTSVPIKLPWTVLSSPLNRSTPRPFADITLRASTVVPPTRQFEALIKTPRSVFPRGSVPVTSVPMKLPCTVFPVPPNETPSPMFPEIRRLVWRHGEHRARQLHWRSE